MTRAIIGATSALCSIGSTSEQVWASARAGIGRITSSQVMDRNFEPIRMGLVPEDYLPPLPAELDAVNLPPRARRMLRLAAVTLASVVGTLPGPARVLLGVPELDAKRAPWLVDFLAYLSMAARVPLDLERSGLIACGRAASLRAVEDAFAALAEDPASPVIVGGVDSHFDVQLLAALGLEQRILGSDAMDGFSPGEGAAFFVLHAPTASVSIRTASIEGAASFRDSGHRYGKTPATGEGLAHAIGQLRSRLQHADCVRTCFAGLNGESFDAKQWGVARLRHSDLFVSNVIVEHPADKYGDVGAATGALLTVMAATAISKSQRQVPVLVWAASDLEPRACVLLSAA